MIKIEFAHLFKVSITEPIRVVCIILSFVIPYGVYKFNLYLHQVGDPPWKQQEKEQQKGQQ